MKNKKNQKNRSLHLKKDFVSKLNQEAVNGGAAPTTNGSSGNTKFICCSDICQFTRPCDRQEN